MSILTYRPKELIDHRRELSDLKNDTDSLTFPNEKSGSNCVHEVRDLKDRLYIKMIERQSDEDYLNSLLDD